MATQGRRAGQSTVPLPDALRRLSAVDAGFLYQERAGLAMNIGGLIVLERPRGAEPVSLDRLRARVDERLAALPHLRAQLAQVPFDLARPVWVPDRTFRVERHVRDAALEGNGENGIISWQKILGFVERTQNTPFERDKPLWDITLLPGSAPRQHVLHVRYHHALVDGLRAIATSLALFDDPGETAGRDVRPRMPSAMPSEEDLVAAAMAEGGTRQIQRSLELVLDVLDPLGSLRRERRVIDGALAFLSLPPAPRAPLNGPVGPERCHRTAVVSSAELTAIRRRYGVSAHDVVLGLVAGALARLFAARGQRQRAVRALVPMARMPPPQERLVGNHAAFCFVDLPVAPAADGDRLLSVSAAATAAKQSSQVATSREFIGRADDEPPLMTMYTARALADQEDVNLVVTYLRRGGRLPTMLGAQHVVTYPLLPLSGRVGLFIGAVEVGGQVGFGITCDPSIVPQPGYLASALRETANGLLTGAG